MNERWWQSVCSPSVAVENDCFVGRTTRSVALRAPNIGAQDTIYGVHETKAVCALTTS